MLIGPKMSIITHESLERCADELERKEHIEALRTLEHARAKKRINDHYDAMIRGESPEHPHRRMVDRRSSWSSLARFAAVPQPSDMADVNLHLSI